MHAYIIWYLTRFQGKSEKSFYISMELYRKGMWSNTFRENLFTSYFLQSFISEAQLNSFGYT